jgi:Cof subfamily protein (haloacid dehalogenase superfamily)
MNSSVEIGVDKSMREKLIAIDVDGTLLTDQYKITERTKGALQQALELGVKVVLATGRGPKSCFPIIDELQLKEPIITHNGAVILDPISRTIKLEIGFQAEELLPVIQYCRSKGIHFDVNTALDMYIEGVTPEAELMYEKFFMVPTQMQDTSLLKEQIVKFTLFGPQESMDQVHDEVLPLFPDWSIIRSGEFFIDIIHPKATKGAALRHLMEQYEIKAHEVIAFGNYFNDLEMLQLAGLGIAMENSPQEVKALADRVTSSNNDDGVAIVLEELMSIIPSKNK